MTWYEAIIWLAGICGGIGTIWALIEKLAKPLRERLKKADDALEAIEEMKPRQHDLYVAVLRLTIMNTEMPLSERLIAGKKYVDEGGNGDVKAYYEKLIAEHTK